MGAIERSRLRWLGVWMALALFPVCSLFGQTPHGTISGQVTGSKGLPVDDGFVEVKDVNKAGDIHQGRVWTGKTDDNGQFTVKLPPGSYQVTCVDSDSLPQVRTIQLKPGQTVKLRFHLKRRRVILAYSQQAEGPGKMRLLPGYVAGNLEGTQCIDTECGDIWNSRRVSIVNYDIGGLASIWFKRRGDNGSGPRFGEFWDGEATINSQLVQYAVFGEDKPSEMRVTFPASYANFDAEVHSEEEIRRVLRMLLTYQGKGYKPDPSGVIDARLIRPDGTPLAGVEVVLQRSAVQGPQALRTDGKGHVCFLAILPGHYQLKIGTGGVCTSAPQHWKITMKPAEILLRSFPVQCR